MFQQEGVLVQLQHRPLTKDPVWKNNVTAVEERKMDGQMLLGVVTAEPTGGGVKVTQESRT